MRDRASKDWEDSRDKQGKEALIEEQREEGKGLQWRKGEERTWSLISSYRIITCKREESVRRGGKNDKDGKTSRG